MQEAILGNLFYGSQETGYYDNGKNQSQNAILFSYFFTRLREKFHPKWILDGH